MLRLLPRIVCVHQFGKFFEKEQWLYSNVKVALLILKLNNQAECSYKKNVE